MHLHCKSPNVLEIHAADYGGAADTCENGQELHHACSVVDRTQIVKSRCDNKPLCSIVALDFIFGDPCPGLNNYLNVIYACGKSNCYLQELKNVSVTSERKILSIVLKMCVSYSRSESKNSSVVLIESGSPLVRLGFRR